MQKCCQCTQGHYTLIHIRRCSRIYSHSSYAGFVHSTHAPDPPSCLSSMPARPLYCSSSAARSPTLDHNLIFLSLTQALSLPRTPSSCQPQHSDATCKPLPSPSSPSSPPPQLPRGGSTSAEVAAMPPVALPSPRSR